MCIRDSIGTGSGCIAIALAKKWPKASVYALDVSADALKMAKQNAALNKVEVVFVEADILGMQGKIPSADEPRLKLNELKFDIIVSNPPYVRELEKQYMKPNVLNNEPHLALFVKDENPLVFYKTTVSYTHLDVYKRQGLGRVVPRPFSAICRQRFIKVSCGFKKNIIECLFPRFCLGHKLRCNPTLCNLWHPCTALLFFC